VNLRKLILQLVSLGALAATLLPPLLFFAGQLTLAEIQPWMLLGTLAWFASAPFWMEHKTGA